MEAEDNTTPRYVSCASGKITGTTFSREKVPERWLCTRCRGNYQAASGPVKDLLNWQQIHEEAEQRKKAQHPENLAEPSPSRTCHSCGKPTSYTLVNRGLTSQVWCEMCYTVALDNEKARNRFNGEPFQGSTRGITRHLMHNESLKKQGKR